MSEAAIDASDLAIGPVLRTATAANQEGILYIGQPTANNLPPVRLFVSLLLLLLLLRFSTHVSITTSPFAVVIMHCSLGVVVAAFNDLFCQCAFFRWLCCCAAMFQVAAGGFFLSKPKNTVFHLEVLRGSNLIARIPIMCVVPQTGRHTHTHTHTQLRAQSTDHRHKYTQCYRQTHILFSQTHTSQGAEEQPRGFCSKIAPGSCGPRLCIAVKHSTLHPMPHPCESALVHLLLLFFFCFPVAGFLSTCLFFFSLIEFCYCWVMAFGCVCVLCSCVLCACCVVNLVAHKQHHPFPLAAPPARIRLGFRFAPLTTRCSKFTFRSKRSSLTHAGCVVRMKIPRRWWLKGNASNPVLHSSTHPFLLCILRLCSSIRSMCVLCACFPSPLPLCLLHFTFAGERTAQHAASPIGCRRLENGCCTGVVCGRFVQ